MNKRCGNCAYAEKNNGRPVWCKFHGESINENNICNDYLDYLDSPVMSSLLKSVHGKKEEKEADKRIPLKYRIKDSIAWAVILFFIAAGVLAFLYC